MPLYPINKHTVLKQTKLNGTWSGVIAPSKAMPKGVWNIGLDVLLCSDHQGNVYHVSYGVCRVEPLEDMLSSFRYYNCNSELGQRIRFWEDTK
jgi:hypothetical protein